MSVTIEEVNSKIRKYLETEDGRIKYFLISTIGTKNLLYPYRTALKYPRAEELVCLADKSKGFVQEQLKELEFDHIPINWSIHIHNIYSRPFLAGVENPIAPQMTRIFGYVVLPQRIYRRLVAASAKDSSSSNSGIIHTLEKFKNLEEQAAKGREEDGRIEWMRKAAEEYKRLLEGNPGAENAEIKTLSFDMDDFLGLVYLKEDQGYREPSLFVSMKGLSQQEIRLPILRYTEKGGLYCIDVITVCREKDGAVQVVSAL